jgi:molybdate transport system substrate-binding protein
MKKILFIMAVLFLALCVTVSGSPRKEASPGVELVGFGAASMTETPEQIAELYKKVSPNVKLVFNFDSSGTLKTQIEQGAECDVFVSAGQLQMNQLDITANSQVNTGGLDFVLQGTRTDLLENKVTLCVPSGNPGNIRNFTDLANNLRSTTNPNFLFAIGNSDVPVGQYTQRIFSFFNLDEKTLANSGKITYGSNVKEVTTQIAEASVTCGVVYCTDAFSAGLQVVDYATAEMCGQIIYPAAVIKEGKNPEAAVLFLDYLKTGDVADVFEKVGFAAVK